MTATRDPLGWAEADCRTPAWAVRAILPRLLEFVPPIPCDLGQFVLDAGCGSGAIADVLAEVYPSVYGVDTRDLPTGRQPGGWWRVRVDFLAMAGLTMAGDLVVTNPPFTLPGWTKGRYRPDVDGVLRFTRRALEVAPVACVLHRSGWWHEMQPERVAFRAELRAGWVTERWALGRVAFLGGGAVDSTPYAWLICRPPTEADGPGPWPTREYDCEVVRC